MRSVGEHGRSEPVMMYGDDIKALDEYLVKKGLLDESLYLQVETAHWLRPALVKARKEAIHNIFQMCFAEENQLKAEENATPEQPAV